MFTLVIIYNEVLSYQHDQQLKSKASIPLTTVSSSPAVTTTNHIDSNGNAKSSTYTLCHFQLYFTCRFGKTFKYTVYLYIKSRRDFVGWILDI